jgi:hypothetical protein
LPSSSPPLEEIFSSAVDLLSGVNARCLPLLDCEADAACLEASTAAKGAATLPAWWVGLKVALEGRLSSPGFVGVLTLPKERLRHKMEIRWCRAYHCKRDKANKLQPWRGELVGVPVEDEVPIRTSCPEVTLTDETWLGEHRG